MTRKLDREYDAQGWRARDPLIVFYACRLTNAAWFYGQYEYLAIYHTVGGRINVTLSDLETAGLLCGFTNFAAVRDHGRRNGWEVLHDDGAP